MKPLDREASVRTLDADLDRRVTARATGTFLGVGGFGLVTGLGGAYLFDQVMFAVWGVAALVMFGFLSANAPPVAFDRRRIAYARAILTGLDLEPDATVALRVAFDPTEGARHAVPRRPDLRRHDWLVLRATFASGVELVLERAEELRVGTVLGTRRFVPSAEDRVTLRLPEPASGSAYRVAGRDLAFPPSLSLAAPDWTEWTHQKVEPKELVLAFRDERPWDVGTAPDGGADAPLVTLRLLRRIAKAADLPPLTRAHVARSE